MNWKLDLRQFERAERALQGGNEEAVKAALQTGRDGVRRRVPSPENPGPYATGGTQESAYIATGDGQSDYSERRSAANAKNPDADFEPEVKAPRDRDGVANGVLGVSTSHAKHVEAGHITRSGSHVAPNPFLAPSLPEAEAQLQRELEKTLRKVGFR